MSHETTPTTEDGPGDGRGVIDETWSWEDEARKLRTEMGAAARAIVAQAEERKGLERELGEAREALEQAHAQTMNDGDPAHLLWVIREDLRAALAPKM